MAHRRPIKPILRGHRCSAAPICLLNKNKPTGANEAERIVENIRHVILYCSGRPPEAGTHWKDEIPDLPEAIRDFVLIAKIGVWKIFHCIMNPAQVDRIKAWIGEYNAGKADPQKIWYWVGSTADEAFLSLWHDPDSFAHTIAKRSLRYPIEKEEDGLTFTIFVSAEAAENAYGITIDEMVLKNFGIPHRFYGVD